MDDDEAGRELSLYNLSAAGHAVDAAGDGRQAIECFAPGTHDLVVTDLRMPGTSGMQVLEHVRDEAPDVPVVVITAHGSVEVAVQAMRAGAYDFIEKPFARDVLLMAVTRALEHRHLTLENRALRRRASGVERPIIWASTAMEELLRTTDRLARSDAAVLITGESGTGKELIARRLHARSERAEDAFVPVNCAAVPPELLESELFGHEKGAYTGADRARAGRFRQAAGGTVFLDEVGEIPLALQGKLLRVLQEKTVDVIGRDRPVTVDVRVVAATNQSLTDRIEEGSFRQDLYYRLNVVEVQVPPLIQRMEDVEPLVRHFVALFAPGRRLAVGPEVLDELRRHNWPGNVRELQNACERLVVLCVGDTLRVQDLPPAVGVNGIASPGGGEWPPMPPEGLSLVDLECRVIERALQLKAGNVSQAAAYLGVPRHVLAYRINKHGLRRG